MVLAERTDNWHRLSCLSEVSIALCNCCACQACLCAPPPGGEPAVRDAVGPSDLLNPLRANAGCHPYQPDTDHNNSSITIELWTRQKKKKMQTVYSHGLMISIYTLLFGTLYYQVLSILGIYIYLRPKAYGSICASPDFSYNLILVLIQYETFCIKVDTCSQSSTDLLHVCTVRARGILQ